MLPTNPFLTQLDAATPAVSDDERRGGVARADPPPLTGVNVSRPVPGLARRVLFLVDCTDSTRWATAQQSRIHDAWRITIPPSEIEYSLASSS